MYDYDQVKELIGLVSETGLGELEIERNGFRLRIVGTPAPQATLTAPAPQPVVQIAPSPPATPGAPEAAPAAPSEATREESGALEEAEGEGHHILRSPIVGTFYAAPSPEAPPFVKPGDRIERGQVVCIVEAMKLMNEIEADCSGVIVEVLQENAEPVEFGQPLFSVREDG